MVGKYWHVNCESWLLCMLLWTTFQHQKAYSSTPQLSSNGICNWGNQQISWNNQPREKDLYIVVCKKGCGWAKVDMVRQKVIPPNILLPLCSDPPIFIVSIHLCFSNKCLMFRMYFVTKWAPRKIFHRPSWLV